MSGNFQFPLIDPLASSRVCSPSDCWDCVWSPSTWTARRR